MFIDKELADAAGPRPDVRQELLYALDSALSQAGKPVLGSIVDVDDLAVVHIV